MIGSVAVVVTLEFVFVSRLATVPPSVLRPPLTPPRRGILDDEGDTSDSASGNSEVCRGMGGKMNGLDEVDDELSSLWVCCGVAGGCCSCPKEDAEGRERTAESGGEATVGINSPISPTRLEAIRWP